MQSERIHSILKMAFAEYRCSVHIRNPDSAAYDDLFPETFGMLYDWLKETDALDEDDHPSPNPTWDYWNALDDFDRILMRLHPLADRSGLPPPTEEEVFQALLKAYRLSLLV